MSRSAKLVRLALGQQDKTTSNRKETKTDVRAEALNESVPESPCQQSETEFDSEAFDDFSATLDKITKERFRKPHAAARSGVPVRPTKQTALKKNGNPKPSAVAKPRENSTDKQKSDGVSSDTTNEQSAAPAVGPGVSHQPAEESTKDNQENAVLAEAHGDGSDVQNSEAVAADKEDTTHNVKDQSSLRAVRPEVSSQPAKQPTPEEKVTDNQKHADESVDPHEALLDAQKSAEVSGDRDDTTHAQGQLSVAAVEFGDLREHSKQAAIVEIDNILSMQETGSTFHNCAKARRNLLHDFSDPFENEAEEPTAELSCQLSSSSLQLISDSFDDVSDGNNVSNSNNKHIGESPQNLLESPGTLSTTDILEMPIIIETNSGSDNFEIGETIELVMTENGNTSSTIIHSTPKSQLDTNGGDILFVEPSESSLSIANASSVSPKRPRSRSSSASSSPTRKRSRNEIMWKRNVNRLLKNSGQAYETARGKQSEGAKMRPPCACKSDCVHKITQEERSEIFQTFWKLANHERQWEFIRANTTCSKTSQKKDKPDNKKKVFHSYYLTVNGKIVKICKQMFMRTLGIWDSWITSAFNHINPTKGNTVSPDKRGRHAFHLKVVTPAIVASVKEHINLFPRVPSHYCRKRSKREYLERGLSINKMAKFYRTWAAEKKLPPTSIASKRQYRDILNSNFNIAFFKPKKDQCSLCLLMRNNPRQVREEKKKTWVTHINNKKLSRALKEKDKAEAMKDKSIAVSSFDLQKQLTCPKSEDSAMYYHSKLNIYNFTVFNMIERLGKCYLWHEGVGKKGSSETSSALLQYIEELVKKGHTDLRFYSDNCGGQNKNRFLFSMYLFACVKYQIKITHRYLETGHTQMEVDNIHANIERATEKIDMYDFEDWVKAIEDTKQELPKYDVVKLTQQSIFSFRSLVPMQNWDVDLQRNKITWRKVKEIHINGQEGSLVRLKYDYNTVGYDATMSTNKRGHPINLKTYKPPLAYEGNIPLSTETIKGINALLKGLHVPLHRQTFLKNVLLGVNPVEEEVVSEIEYDTDEDEGEVEIEGEENEDDVEENENSREENEEDGEDED